MEWLLGLFGLLAVAACLIGLAFVQYRKVMRDAKNIERGLKMVPLKIHLPPASEDIEGNNRDERDVTEETISQAQVMYNIISSTATNGFKSNLYGQRHVTFEIVATKGMIDYYVVVPIVLIDVLQQAVAAAYPSARLEEVEEHNIFNKVSKISGTIGGELTLKKAYSYPIATYEISKRDAMRAILNALSTASHEDGVGVQILIRPAAEGWVSAPRNEVHKIKRERATGRRREVSNVRFARDILEALWKAPTAEGHKGDEVETQLTTLEQNTIDAMEEKARHPGYETLVRVIASSNTAARSQVLLKNVVSAFALFDSPTFNGFRFTVAKNIEEFVTAYIMRYFPQQVRSNILNSVELATIFHLPDQDNIPTSKLQRQMSKQVDGPRNIPEEGLLVGYNIYRGTKKEIRLATNDRRRHLYMIGQTGTGKSGFLENLALQDILDGRGLAFIDPHGDVVEKLLGMIPKERVEDVIYFCPADMENPIGLNLFEFDSPDERDFLIQEAIGMLYKLYDPGHTGIIGPRYEHWFRHAAITLMSDPNGSSFIDVPQVFNDNDFAKEKLKYVTDQTTLDFWNKEMAQTSDYHKSEMLGWFVSKFGAFLSNEMMRNIIGQTKSGFNIRDIMDNGKILLVNLSKGKTGELNSQLLGMIFVMKFQAAAMSRADIPEDQRRDFSLYVDEFQNFATDSFESILSEARKYRLSLLLANQFVSQLTDKIREAIIGNVGTIISGRIGTTDAELMAKRFQPVFDVEDLTKIPNYEGVAIAQINGVPSAPFSMNFLPPLGSPNPQLASAMKRLSAAKYGKPRAVVEKDIFGRLRAGDAARDEKKKAIEERAKSVAPAGTISSTGSSFLDDWLAKRKQKTQPPKQAPQLPAQAKPAPAQSSQPVQATRQPEVSVRSEDIQNESNVSRSTTGYATLNAESTKSAPVEKVSEADDNLQALQSTGVGTNVQISSEETAGAAQATPTTGDMISMQHTLDNVSEAAPTSEEATVPVEPKDTLHIAKKSDEELAAKGSDVDEIFIDLRGNIKHTNTSLNE